MNFTAGVEWFEIRLNRGAWFRRAYVVAATVLTWQVVYWSFQFAKEALAAKADLIGVAAVLAAINGGVSLVQSGAFRQYLEAKKGVTT